MRRFVLLAHRAPTTAAFRLEDLPGSGRMDLVCRVVAAAFVVSHDVRRDTVLDVLLQGPPDPPRTIRFEGRALRSLNPDERSTAALLRRALQVRPTGTYWQPSTPGVSVARAGLADLLAGAPVVVLAEDGEEARSTDLPDDVVFVVGDDLGFTPEEERLLAGARRVSLGPTSLHADHCVVLVQNELDRRTEGPRMKEEG